MGIPLFEVGSNLISHVDHCRVILLDQLKRKFTMTSGTNEVFLSIRISLIDCENVNLPYASVE